MEQTARGLGKQFPWTNRFMLSFWPLRHPERLLESRSTDRECSFKPGVGSWRVGQCRYGRRKTAELAESPCATRAASGDKQKSPRTDLKVGHYIPKSGPPQKAAPTQAKETQQRTGRTREKSRRARRLSLRYRGDCGRMVGEVGVR